MMLIKLSIGFFLLRLATQKVYVWILRVSLVVIVIWSMVTFIWNIFQCSPVEKQWDFRIVGGKCVTPNQIVQAAYALSVLCIVSDWLFVSLGTCDGDACDADYFANRLFSRFLCFGR